MRVRDQSDPNACLVKLLQGNLDVIVEREVLTSSPFVVDFTRARVKAWTGGSQQLDRGGRVSRFKDKFKGFGV